jgi:hypothetical protein
MKAWKDEASIRSSREGLGREEIKETTWKS